MTQESPARAAQSEVQRRTAVPYDRWECLHSTAPIENPEPLGHPWDPGAEDPADRGEVPGSRVVCGCHRRVDGEAWLCAAHLAELNDPSGIHQRLVVLKAWTCDCRIAVDELLSREARPDFEQDMRCSRHADLHDRIVPGTRSWRWACQGCGASGQMPEDLLGPSHSCPIEGRRGPFAEVHRLDITTTGTPVPVGSELLEEIDPIDASRRLTA